jgi:hypothetical protein
MAFSGVIDPNSDPLIRFCSVLSERIVSEVPMYWRPLATIAAFKVCACRASRPKVGIEAAVLASARRVGNNIIVEVAKADILSLEELLDTTMILYI